MKDEAHEKTREPISQPGDVSREPSFQCGGLEPCILWLVSLLELSDIL